MLVGLNDACTTSCAHGWFPPVLSLRNTRSGFGFRIDVARHHELERHLVGIGGVANTDSGLNINYRSFVIDGHPAFLELIVRRIEVTQRAKIGVSFRGNRPFVIQVAGESRGGNKFQAPRTAGIFGIYDRVHDDVPRLEMQANDRTQLRRDMP